MTSKIVFCLPLTLLLLTVAEAQQPTKIPRIGYLDGAFPSTNAARIDAFRQGLRELGYVEGKNIVIEYRHAEGKLDRLPALAAELVRLKVDVIVTGGGGACNRFRQGSDKDDSHCHGGGYRSGWTGVCDQPCAAWRKRHWIVNPCPGDKRKTTGASERDRSQALPCGGPWDFNRRGQRTVVKGGEPPQGHLE